MIYKRPSQIVGHIQITFHLPACLWADKVAVVGDFNHWDKTANSLLQDKDGSWIVAVDLPQGRTYRFLYWVDGDLKTEFRADSFVTGSDNREYSVIYTYAATPAENPSFTPGFDITLGGTLGGRML